MPTFVEIVAQQMAAVEQVHPAVMAEVQAHLKDTLGCGLCALSPDTSVAVSNYARDQSAPPFQGCARCSAVQALAARLVPTHDPELDAYFPNQAPTPTIAAFTSALRQARASDAGLRAAPKADRSAFRPTGRTS